MEEGEAPEEFGAVGLDRVEGPDADEVLGHRILHSGAQVEVLETGEGGDAPLLLDLLERPLRHLLELGEAHAERPPGARRRPPFRAEAGAGSHAAAGAGGAGEDEVAGVMG